MADEIKDFIIFTSTKFFNIQDFQNDTALQKFLLDEQCMILYVVDRNGFLSFHTEITSNKNRSLIFYKDKPSILETKDDLSHVNVTTFLSNPVESLYTTLHHVYGPMLQTDASNPLDPKIQEMISHLEAVLRTTAFGKDGGPSLLVVLTVGDELEYWNTILNESKTRKQREMAESFISVLEPLADEIRSVDVSNAVELRDIMESCGGLIDDLWRHSTHTYPQKRMAHLMDIIGNACVIKLQDLMSPIDVWTQDQNTILLLKECLSAATSWLSACYTLTQKFWPNHSMHSWEGEPHVPTYLNNFQKRLSEVVDVRSIHLQLTKLLTPDEQASLHASKMFDSFKGLNIWQCTPNNNINWTRALTQFQRLLRPAEDRIAEKLRPRLVGSSTKQMLYEFGRYSSLIERPAVYAALEKECQIFCSALGELLKEIESQIMDDKEQKGNDMIIPDLSPFVQQLQWTKRTKTKVAEIEAIIDRLLSNLDSSIKLKTLAQSIQKDLTNLQIQLYEDWTQELQVQLNNKSLYLSPDSPVVEFSPENNLMHVTFNPKLVTLERNVRHLSCLGFTIQPAIKEIVARAAQFMDHARILQQVANFHNTQADRMILSQRPMMLQAAVNLASLVKEESAVPWKDTKAVALYVEKLKKAVSDLETQNTFLTNEHISMRNIVLKLMDTPLLQKQNDWKKGIRQMREIIDKVEERGFTNNKVWKHHWDIQLYKALEHQYRSTLIDPLSHLNVTRVELIFRQQEVRLQPPMEEIRGSVYSQLKKLIALPKHFVGLQTMTSDEESLFASIIPGNSWLMAGALKEVEQTLLKVKESTKKWSRWAALGVVGDLENLCQLHLQHSDDWDRNFRECKAMGQSIAKLPMEDEKIDWIWISSTSLRSELEAQNRRYWAALTTSLQSSLQQDSNSLEEYISAAQNALNQVVPKNAKELATANEEIKALKEKESQMSDMLANLRKKQSMVRAWGGERLRPLDHIAKQWETVTTQLQNYEQLILHQAESVKASLLGEWSNLYSSLEVWYSRWNQNRPKPDQLSNATLSELRSKHHMVTEALSSWSNFKENKENMITECRKFDLELEVKPLWDECETKMIEDSNFWETFKEFNDSYSVLSSQEWIVIQKKLHLLDEFVADWSKRLEPYTAITLFIQKEINQYKDIIPSMKHLRSSDFTERHWREIFSLLDMQYKSVDEIALGDILEASANIKIHSKDLQKIWSSASQEAVVRGAVAELELWMAGARFTMVKHIDSKGQDVPIIKNYKDILNKVEEYESLAGSARSMSGGSNESSGTDQLAIWETRLSQLRSALTSLSHVQRKWIYLEPILRNSSSVDTAFVKLDRDWRQVAKTLDSDSRVSALMVRLPAFIPLLESLTQQLQKCQAALQHFISEKRSVFPRLYFLNDDDLLELAAGTKSGREAALQAHVKKLFPGSTGLQLGPGGVSVTALVTQNDQKLVLDSAVDIDAPIEVWLKRLEEEMKSSLKNCIFQCLRIGSTQNRDTLVYPTQVLCLVQNLKFTEMTERAITGKNLHSLKDSIKKELEDYFATEIDANSEQLDKTKLQALILQCNNHLDILDELIDNNVSYLDHWVWMKQLRFYVENKNEIFIHMGLAKLGYTYEYLGAKTGNLVRTQLTEECFFILMQAIHLGQAGNPFGPAGTGKTETVKALGGLLGRLVLVFNCDEGLDKTTFGRLLTGIALSGSWGCFDEFNRLEERTLTGITQQISSLLQAIANNDSNPVAILNGKEVNVVSGCGVFVTMNPAGAGYGGRRILPSSLSTQLRPIAMCHPRANHIARILLAAQSFSKSSTLADKLVMCFQMASSQLSPLHHYDWGLRALKTVIGSCGSALRDFVLKTNRPPSENEELSLVIGALQLNTHSKLSYEDSISFENIIKIVFPGIEVANNIQEHLQQALIDSYKALKLTCNEVQMRKCMELYEQLKQRMGVVIVGPPGSGKSTIRLLLKHALNKLGQNISQHIICPKAMSRTDLLGYIDSDTRQWYDGVISSSALAVTSQSPDVWSWIVCDGDVDPEWIESLNSVLDDNRLLTLPSGWRVQFGDNVNFVFETHNLDQASPATITRMGIILLSEQESCSMELIDSWVQSSGLSEDLKSQINPLLEVFIMKMVEWIPGSFDNFVIPRHTVALIKQVLGLIGIAEIYRVSLDEYIASAIATALSSVVYPEFIDSVIQQVSEWTEVSSHMLLWKKPSLLELGWSSTAHSDSFLYSDRIQAMLELTQSWLDSFQHFMIVGPPASGKSFIVEHLLKEVRDYTVINLQCTPVFNHQHIIRALKQNSVVSLGGNRSTGRVVLIIRSLHRVSYDTWKSSMVQSFLLQLIQYNGFWERVEGGTLRWVSLGKFLLVITATTDDKLFKPCPRLTNSVHLAHLKAPDDQELYDICSLHLNNSLKHFAKTNSDKQKLQDLSTSMFSLYRECCESFTSETQYKWTPRDLTLWSENLAKYKIDKFQEISNAICEEAVYIFKDRLISMEDITLFDSLSVKYLGSPKQCFMPRMGDNGVIMEPVEHQDYKSLIDKIINQCNLEAENDVNGAFGDSNVECCKELQYLCTRAGNSIGKWVIMAGVTGVGRRAATKIAANIIGAKMISVATPQQFHSQIKNIISLCGDGNPVILLVEEGAAQSEEVLGALEGLQGGVPPMDPGELEAVVNGARMTSSEQRNIGSFVQNIHKYLGIVLLLDVKDKNLKKLLESNRLLYEQCHFIWLDKWEEATMREMPVLIAKRLLTKNPGMDISKDVMPVENIFDLYSSIKSIDLDSPYRFTVMLKAYLNFFQQNKHSLEDKRSRLQAGISALLEAQAEVSRLKTEAAQQEKVLNEKQSKANEALNQIASTMQSATSHKEELQELKKNMERENINLSERKKQIELELADVEPVILEARAAVGDIKPESLSEVRSLRAPPEPVRDVLEGVLRLMNIADTSWHSMKQFLSRRGIKEDIRTFDASNISKENLAAVEKLVASKQASFTEKTAKRASVACAPLAAWVLANIKYAHVLHKIAPLESEQRALTRNLEDAKAQIINLSSGLNTVDERVAMLKEQLNNYTKEATEIEIKLSAAKSTISKAEQLVSKLSIEFQRWQSSLEELKTKHEEIPTRALLAAGYIFYLSNETEENRELLIKTWCQQFDKNIQDFSIKDFLVTHDVTLEWSANGLPTDSAALNNAVILNEVLNEHKNGLVPLVIDPSGVSLQWLLKQFASFPKDIVRQFNEKFHMSLQHAIRFGKIFIVEDLITIDDSWSSLLRGQIPNGMGGVNSINPSFRLILISRDSSILGQIQPYHRAAVSVVDFTPQLQGLIAQFVYHAVKQEEPELQEELARVNSVKSTLQAQQTALQTTLLSQLSSGDILHNAPLLQALEQTQSSSEEIQLSLEKAAELGRTVEVRCNQYKKIATKTAKICLALSSIAQKYPLTAQNINCIIPIYLKKLASHTVKKSGNDLEVDVICKEIFISVMERVLTALHKENHISVIIYLLHLVYPEHIPTQEWEVLIKIPEPSGHNQGEGLPSWIHKDCWIYVNTLKTQLPDLYKTLNFSNMDIWSRFSTSGEWDDIPTNISITPFQKMLIFWAQKPDKLYTAFTKATSSILGINHLFPQGDLLSVVERWGSPKQPIIVVESPGTDPLEQIRIRAGHTVGSHHYKQVWISQDSDLDSIQGLKYSIEWANSSEAWLCVVVPADAWSDSTLQGLLLHTENNLDDESKCRIWIVTEDFTKIPPQLSSMCINVIMEPPAGIKSNILRTLSLWAPVSSSTNGSGLKNANKCRLEFALALTHSIIQERSSFIPQGWRSNYNFSWSDAEACAAAIKTWGRGDSSGGLCSALYAGRITCPRDTQLVHALVLKNFNENVLGHTWKPLGLTISLPNSSNLQDYLKALMQFPNVDLPSYLGLANNVYRVKEQLAGNDVLKQLKIFTHSEVSSRHDVKLWKKILTPTFLLWKKLNESNSLIKAKSTDIKLKSDGSNGLIEQEWLMAVKAVKEVHSDLSFLRSGVIDINNRELAENLVEDKTPVKWLTYWEGGPKVASVFLRGLCSRAAAIRQHALLATTVKDQIPPQLSSLLRPGRVINTLLWSAAVKFNKPPEGLTLVTKWGGDVSKSDEEVGSVVLRDLLLEGAVWEGEKLQPCRNNTPPQTPAPPILLKYIPKDPDRELQNKFNIEIPIYTSPERTHLVFNIGAPLADQFNVNLWLLNSTALIIPSTVAKF